VASRDTSLGFQLQLLTCELEINLAENAEKYRAGTHPGWEPTALDGLTLSLEVLNEKRIKVVINGGSLNPKGLAEKVQSMVRHARTMFLTQNRVAYNLCLGRGEEVKLESCMGIRRRSFH
jgi:hypothetical protein